jgi:hypothetical protein
MEEETRLDPIANVPERYFPQWLREQSKTERLKLRYDLAKESVPHISALFVYALTLIFCKEALIVVLPIVTWILRKKHLG